jgi:hypothetical protein
MLHTIVDPMEVLLTPSEQPITYRELDGCLCECVGTQVRRLISTSLDDYLRPELNPGGRSTVTTELTLPKREFF